MSTVVVATSAADAQAVEAVKDHHAQLAGALAVQVEALLDAAARGDARGADTAIDTLLPVVPSRAGPTRSGGAGHVPRSPR